MPRERRGRTSGRLVLDSEAPVLWARPWRSRLEHGVPVGVAPAGDVLAMWEGGKAYGVPLPQFLANPGELARAWLCGIWPRTITPGVA